MLRIKIRYFALALAMLGGMVPVGNVRAATPRCPELKIVFARGSGETHRTGESYLALKSSLESKLAGTGIDYEIEDLSYPAVGVGNILTMLGALFGGGEVYEFGRSVNTGVDRLVAEVNSACTDTKYVVAGYSQGAMVVSKSLRQLDSSRVIYAATFGDPKIYLPEGAGVMPIACQGLGLSDYRMYVPDCRAYIGKLGTYPPYQPEDFAGKMGTWCNRMDIFCSSYLSIASHTSYVADDLYEDASRVIYEKVIAEFGVERDYVSPHDTAILIDSTDSMRTLIDRYKEEALRLATQTLETGGRAALYDYGDFKDGNTLTKRCDFTCTLDEFKAGLAQITPVAGGDGPESLLGASFAVMNELNWRLGTTKSLVVLTDAGYHNPDFDGRHTTLADVVNLSKQIDPVNIYVVTTESAMRYYEEQLTELATATGGRVATTVEDLSLLTDEIMARYDSLPRVEEWLDDGEELPAVEILSINHAGTWGTVKFRASTGRVMVALNDVFLGVVEGEEFTITDLEIGTENILTLVPISETRSGQPVSILLTEAGIFVPKTPDTGQASAL